MTKHIRPHASAARRGDILRRVDDMVTELDAMLASGMGDFTLDETERLTTPYRKLCDWLKRARNAR